MEENCILQLPRQLLVCVALYFSSWVLIWFFLAKESSQEVLRLRQELAETRLELERKLAEWRVRDKTGNTTGTTTLVGSDEPMDTSAALRKEANALLGAPSDAGSHGGGGLGGQQQDVPPPPLV